MLKRFIVKKNQRAALLKNGDFERILNPGLHTFFDPFNTLSLTVWETDVPMSDFDVVDYLRQNDPETADAQFCCMQLSEHEAGLRFENDVLVEILPPAARRVFWRGLVAHRLEKIDLRAGAALPADLTPRLL